MNTVRRRDECLAAPLATTGEAGLATARVHPVTGERYRTPTTRPVASAATGASP